MTALCVSAIRGRKFRLIKLDPCGAPVTGASSAVVVGDGFISVTAKPVYEDGAELIKKTASGALCVNEKEPGQLKRVELEVVVCTLDPDSIVIMTGDRLLSTSATGMGVAFSDAQISARYSLEVWQDVSGNTVCNGVKRYVYWAWPNVGNAQVGQYKIENAVLEFSISGETQEASLSWGTLPTAEPPNTYLDDTFGATEHYAYNVTTTTPPTAACGASLLS
jgi:hypothetical protein